MYVDSCLKQEYMVTDDFTPGTIPPKFSLIVYIILSLYTIHLRYDNND